MKTSILKLNSLTPLFCIIFFNFIFFSEYILDRAHIPYDLQYYQFSHYSFLFNSLKSGNLPLWDPFTYAGGPYVTNPQSQLFYLPYMIFTLGSAFFFNEATLYQLQTYQILQLVAFNFFSFKLVKIRVQDNWIAVSISLIITFSGVLLSDLQHVAQLSAILFIPIISLYIHKRHANTEKFDPFLIILCVLFITSGFIPAIVPSLLSIIFILKFLLNMSLINILIKEKLNLIILGITITFYLYILYLGSDENFGVSKFNSSLKFSDFYTIIYPNYFNSFDIANYLGSIDITKGYSFLGPVVFLSAWGIFKHIKKPVFYVSVVLIVFTLFNASLLNYFDFQFISTLIRPIEFRIFFLIIFMIGISLFFSSPPSFTYLVVFGITELFILISASNDIDRLISLFTFVIFILSIFLSGLAFGRFSFSKNFIVLYAAFIFLFHFLIHNQIWKSENSVNDHGRLFIRYTDTLTIREMQSLLQAGSRVAANAELLGADFWNGWRVFGFPSLNGWEPNINKNFGSLLYSQSRRETKSLRHFGEFDLNSDLLRAYNVNLYLSYADQEVAGWKIFNLPLFNAYKRIDEVSKIRSFDCDPSTNITYRIRSDFFLVPIYKITIMADELTKTNCSIQVSEIFRNEWVAKTKNDYVDINSSSMSTIELSISQKPQIIELYYDFKNVVTSFALFYSTMFLLFILSVKKTLIQANKNVTQ